MPFMAVELSEAAGICMASFGLKHLQIITTSDLIRGQ